MKKGYNSHRLKENDKYHSKEVEINNITNHQIKEDKYFLSIITKFKIGENYVEMNERDEKIVLTTLQWLGTPVGESFVNKNESPVFNLRKEVSYNSEFMEQIIGQHGEYRLSKKDIQLIEEVLTWTTSFSFVNIFGNLFTESFGK